MSDPLVESKTAEAANAAAVANQANHEAIDAQLQNAVEQARQSFVKSMHELLTAGENDSVFLRLGRVKFLCTAVSDINTALKDLKTTQQEIKDTQKDHETDLKWIKWAGMGILGGIGLLALKQLGV